MTPGQPKPHVGDYGLVRRRSTAANRQTMEAGHSYSIRKFADPFYGTTERVLGRVSVPGCQPSATRSALTWHVRSGWTAVVAYFLL